METEYKTKIDAPELDSENKVVDLEDKAGEAQSVSDEDQDQGDEVVVTVGDEIPDTTSRRAAPWVRELRKSNREQGRKIRELEAMLVTPTKDKKIWIGKEPKLEELDYDIEAYKNAVTAWVTKNHESKIQDDELERLKKEEDDKWALVKQAYNKSVAELKVEDFDDAEYLVAKDFNDMQQGVLLRGPKNPALVVYAIGKNPKIAKELMSLKTPVAFSFAIADLEMQLKITNKRSMPEPERIVHGSARLSGVVDPTLERLREEAARTGNLTKVIQYKRNKKSAKN